MASIFDVVPESGDNSAAPAGAPDTMIPGGPVATKAPAVADIAEPSGVLNTSWQSTTGGAPVPWGPGQRIREAMYKAFTEAPSAGTAPGNMSVLTPGAQDWMDRNVPLLNNIPKLIGTGVGAVAAAGAGAQQGASELMTGLGVSPQLQRDIQGLPIALGGVAPVELPRTAALPSVKPSIEVPPNLPQLPWPGKPLVAAGAKDVANDYYTLANQKGGTLSPEFTNSWIDNVQAKQPPPDVGAALGVTNPINKLAASLDLLRDKPMSLNVAQGLDEGLGDMITNEYVLGKGLTKSGKGLSDVQGDLRNRIDNAGPDDITGDTSGFDALSKGRDAWSQDRKMADVERIGDRAMATDNPTTSVRTQVRNLDFRGYSPTEQTAVQSAADRGFLGGILHTTGSRLLPIALGAVGGPADFFGTQVAQEGVRGIANAMQRQRLSEALRVLGRGVPDAPTGP